MLWFSKIREKISSLRVQKTGVSISRHDPAIVLITGRLVLAFLAVGLSLTSILNDAVGKSELLELALALVFSLCALSAMYLKRFKAGKIYNSIQILVDSILVTGVIYITGGLLSPFLFLYLLVVMTASVLFSRAFALLSACVVVVCYSGMAFFLKYSLLPLPPGQLELMMPTGGIIPQILGLLSGSSLIAVATHYLITELQLRGVSLTESNNKVEELKIREKALLGQIRSIEESTAHSEKLAEVANSEDLILEGPFVGESRLLHKIKNLIERVAPSEATVLVSGESGTGKELVAKTIHAKSNRKNNSFVAVNCGAIPSELLESELFGHKRGAFTGAVQDSLGLFRKADKGTLFLDEIGELPLHMQAKLLRALQEKSVRPIGADKDIEIDTRIIAATNRNLREEVKKGNFREDLYYRLNVININVPPLRERKEDIPHLIRMVLRKCSHDGKVPTITPRAMGLLINYSYPGNIRELENIIERAVLFGVDHIAPEHIPELRGVVPEVGHNTEIIEDEHLVFPVNLESILDETEKKYILLALEKSDGVKKKAAELLGINFRSMRYRLDKFGIE